MKHISLFAMSSRNIFRNSKSEPLCAFQIQRTRLELLNDVHSTQMVMCLAIRISSFLLNQQLYMKILRGKIQLYLPLSKEKRSFQQTITGLFGRLGLPISLCAIQAVHPSTTCPSNWSSPWNLGNNSICHP